MGAFILLWFRWNIQLKRYPARPLLVFIQIQSAISTFFTLSKMKHHLWYLFKGWNIFCHLILPFNISLNISSISPNILYFCVCAKKKHSGFTFHPVLAFSRLSLYSIWEGFKLLPAGVKDLYSIKHYPLKLPYVETSPNLQLHMKWRK